MQGVAINVGANTNEPGFRAPVRRDGSFEYVPIPESEPTGGPVPTYGDLAPHLSIGVPADLRGTPVHLDPQFAGYPCCDRYTYGDEHGVKARPLAELSAGEYVFFYATLTTAAGGSRPDWMPPRWGAYVVGHFRLARDPVSGEEYDALPAAERARFETNAHVRRAEFDARVLLAGDPDASRLYERAVPLSTGTAGTEAGDLVCEWSSDSGKGPWWRRPLRFDAAGVEELLARARTRS
ncbi:MAG: hypothetical protein ABEJ23_07030 [Haloarculaceae archaeon]